MIDEDRWTVDKTVKYIVALCSITTCSLVKRKARAKYNPPQHEYNNKQQNKLQRTKLLRLL